MSETFVKEDRKYYFLLNEWGGILDIFVSSDYCGTQPSATADWDSNTISQSSEIKYIHLYSHTYLIFYFFVTSIMCFPQMKRHIQSRVNCQTLFDRGVHGNIFCTLIPRDVENNSTRKAVRRRKNRTI